MILPELILAADGGGTKCEALLVDAQNGDLLAGKKISAEELPGEACFFGGFGRSPAALTGLVGKLPPDPLTRPLIFSCNWNRSFPLDMLPRPPVDTVVLSEASSLLALGDRDWGAVAIAGTGVNVYCFAPDGSQVAMDALGPMLGDRGGACWIGWNLLRCAGREAQLTDCAGPIWRAVAKKLDLESNSIDSLWKLVRFSLSNPDRSRIAEFAKLAMALAGQGEPAAQEILKNAAGELAGTIADAVEKAQWQSIPFMLVGSGGIFRHSETIWSEVCRRLAVLYPAARPILPRLPQAAGQVFELWRQAHGRTGAQKLIEKLTDQLQRNITS
jgi:N-acetylglucosamine kinase-like BadF-type ATPase